MFEEFEFSRANLTAAQRPRLQAAILKNDAALFRQILQENPPPDDRFRLYGVMVKTKEGIVPVLVNQSGHRFDGPDAVIPAGARIDMLNMEYSPDEVVVTIGEDIYRTSVQIDGLLPNPSQ